MKLPILGHTSPDGRIFFLTRFCEIALPRPKEEKYSRQDTYPKIDSFISKFTPVHDESFSQKLAVRICSELYKYKMVASSVPEYPAFWNSWAVSAASSPSNPWTTGSKKYFLHTGTASSITWLLPSSPWRRYSCWPGNLPAADPHSAGAVHDHVGAVRHWRLRYPRRQIILRASGRWQSFLQPGPYLRRRNNKDKQSDT
jgi:hypothetical protein